MHRIELPFHPPMEDLKMEVHPEGAACFLFDSCSRSFSAEEKARTDRAVLSIYYEAEKADMTDRQAREGLPEQREPSPRPMGGIFPPDCTSR